MSLWQKTWTPSTGPETADCAFLTFREDGRLELCCFRPDGAYVCTCEGTWEFSFVPDFNDRLILRFTSTDDPSKAGEDYRTECAFEAYAESWVETDTQVTYLILTPVEGWGVAPFADIYDEWEVALHREQGPNMRVVNCSSYVSLRQKPSKSSARLKKVPLGASVLAFPEYGEENGFTCCVYGGEYGWILSEYLEEAE